MGIFERKKREQQQRRESILSAAHRLFAEYGIENTSMTSIAEEAELSKGALYLYFRNKDSIVYELLYSYLTDLRERVLEAAGSGSTGYEKSRRMLEAFSSYHHEHEEYLSLARYLDYRVTSVAEAGAEAARCFGIIDELKHSAVEIIREGQKDGSIRTDIDPALTAATFVHVVESFLLKLSTRKHIIAERSRYDPQELVDNLLELILYSLQ